MSIPEAVYVNQYLSHVMLKPAKGVVQFCAHFFQCLHRNDLEGWVGVSQDTNFGIGLLVQAHIHLFYETIGD